MQIGHIAHINLRDEHKGYEKMIGQVAAVGWVRGWLRVAAICHPPGSQCCPALHVLCTALHHSHAVQVLLDKNPRLKTIVNKTNTIDTVFRVFKMEAMPHTPWSP